MSSVSNLFFQKTSKISIVSILSFYNIYKVYNLNLRVRLLKVLSISNILGSRLRFRVYFYN